MTNNDIYNEGVHFRYLDYKFCPAIYGGDKKIRENGLKPLKVSQMDLRAKAHCAFSSLPRTHRAPRQERGKLYRGGGKVQYGFNNNYYEIV